MFDKYLFVMYIVLQTYVLCDVMEKEVYISFYDISLIWLTLFSYYDFCVDLERYVSGSMSYETMVLPVLNEAMMSMESATTQMKLQEGEKEDDQVTPSHTFQ